MSRTPSDEEDSAVPAEIPSSGPPPPPQDSDATDVPIAIDLPAVLADDELDAPAADDEMLARDALAAADAGTGRVEVLMSARALRADARGDTAAALGLWKAAFDRDPSLLVAFWGLRRALVRSGSWQDLVAALERRIQALGEETADARADLWYQRARVEEDRLGRDDDAARSLRAGLAEAAEHPGLLVSLLLLGFRRGDPGACIEALSGLLRRTLPPALRASATAWLAGLERRAVPREGDGAPPDQGPAAARALEALQAALRTVPSEHAGPLLDELSRLARTTAAPATRAGILGEIISQSGERDPARLVAVLRERARLLRDELSDSAAAVEVLRDAVRRAPTHPIAAAELADLLEVTDRTAGALQEVLATVTAQGSAPPTATQRELALRVVAALGRDGKAADALALLERHPELPRERPDVFALEVMVRAALGDAAGLAAAFEGLAARLLGGAHGATDDAGAHALVVAGALREAGAPGVGAVDTDDDPPLRLYRRAVDLAPNNRAAWEALERRLWTTSRWGTLAAALQDRLAGVESAGGPPASSERVRLLEELVAVHRDLLDDPAAALGFQDRLLALAPTVPAGDAATTRAWVRRLDLDWRAAGRQRETAVADPARTVLTLRTLAERAGDPALAAALRVEGARTAAAAGDVATAGELFAAAVPDDDTGAAVAGLEKLAGHPAAVGGKGADAGRAAAELRAGVVREEIARAQERDEASTGSDPDSAARMRALRFRLAWHALDARRADAAVEALGPLRADGDALARAWSWEIARRSGDPKLALAVLQSTPDAQGTGRTPEMLWARIDLAEALERAGDLRGAEAAFREAHQQERSTDAALGLLRVATARGNAAAVLEATRALVPLAEPQTASLLAREASMLALLGQAIAGAAPEATPPPASDRADDPADVVLGWARGSRAGDPLSAAAALLAFARAIPATAAATAAGGGETDLALDRMGLLARAAARARVGSAALGAAVHDQVQALSSGAAPIGVGLADLPVAGHPERAAARSARAERNGGPLSYALEIERAVDAESRGDARGALEAFARALSRDAEGIEALDGIKRLALRTGDRAGAARAGMRLGMVLRVDARAAAELGMAGQIWEDLGRLDEATIGFWHALARDPKSEWLFERLRELLSRQKDWSGIDLLLGHRLAALADPAARVGLLLERARHRLQHLSDRKAAIDDLKRILKIDPDHAASLRLLATLAEDMEYFRHAVRFLERLLALTTDEARVAALRLELADAHESAREPGRAVEVLRQAVSARPRDATPWQRLIDVLLRLGDWAAALATLRSWDAVVAEPVPKAAVWTRIGTLLRDHARDPDGAATAFTTAADLDPLGDGMRALIELHHSSGANTARLEAIERGVIAMREALVADPLDIPRLRRLQELHQWSAEHGTEAAARTGADGAGVIAQVLALAGEDVAAPATRRRDTRTALSTEFWARIRAAGAGEFASAVWPHLAGAVGELAPLPKGRIPPREKVAAGSEARLGWVEAAAFAVGIPELELALAKAGADAGDASVIALEGAHPTLVVGRGSLAGDAAARFRIGRALGLLRDRATVLDRVDAAEVAAAFAAGAVVAGAPANGNTNRAAGEERARALGKAMSRKDRKALELEASRFGFETIDADGFRSALLETADRLGLLFAGDVAVAVRLAANLAPDAKGAAPAAAAITGNPRALALLRFAVSEDYLTARREIGQGPGNRSGGEGGERG